jgi:Flp pilus assembly protein TadD
MHCRPIPVRRTLAGTLVLLTLCSLTACGSARGYLAAADARAERAAIEAAATPAGDAALASRTTYVRLVEQMQEDGLWFASLAHLDALEQRWGSAPATVRLRADALRQTGQAAESRRQYSELLTTPLAGAGYHGLGLLAGADADFAAAVPLLVQAQQRSPTDAAVLSDLGYAQLRAGRIDAARVPLMQAAQLSPKQPQVQANLALYLLASGQPAQAEAFMTAQRLDPDTRAAIRAAAVALPRPAATAAKPVATPALAAADAATSAPIPPRAASGTRRMRVAVRDATASAVPVAPAVPAERVAASSSESAP